MKVRNLKKSSTLIVSIFVGSLLSSASFAAGYTGSANITWMSSVIGTDAGRYFAIKGNWNNPDECSKASEGIWMIKDLDNSGDNIDSMYSMALGAFMADKPIQLYQDGCENDRPRARSVYLGDR